MNDPERIVSILDAIRDFHEEDLDEMNGSLLQVDRPDEGFVQVFGMSDDLLEFRGGIYDEAGAWAADKRLIFSDGTQLRFWWDDCYGFKIAVLRRGTCEIKLDQPEESLYDDGEEYNGHRATVTGEIKWVLVVDYEPDDGDE